MRTFRLILLTIVQVSLFVSCVMPVCAQPIVQWQRSYGGSAEDQLKGMDLAPDKSCFLVGYSKSADKDVTGNHGNFDTWVVKTDTSGAIIWQKSLGGANSDLGAGVAATKDGGCVVASATNSSNGDVSGNRGASDFWVARLDAQGTLKWQKCYGGTKGERPYWIASASDGGFFIAGDSQSKNGDVPANYGDYDYYIFKTDSLGTILWKKVFGGINFDVAAAICATSDGGCMITGYGYSYDRDFTGAQGNGDALFIKLNADGSLGWKGLYGGSARDETVSVRQTHDGGYISTGWTFSTNGDASNRNHGSGDLWILRMDSIGKVLWKKVYGGSGLDFGYDVQEDVDSGFVVTGYTTSKDWDLTGIHPYIGYDLWFLKVDSTGTLKWQTTLQFKGEEEGLCLRVLGKDDYLVGGVNNDTTDLADNHGNFDYWLTRFHCAPPLVPQITGIGNGLLSTKAIGYQWYFNGAPIPGAVSQIYNPHGLGGSYTVEVSNGCGLTMSDPYLKVVGINGYEASMVKVDVIPNPLGNKGLIRYSLPPDAQSAVFKLYDVRGELLSFFTLDKGEETIPFSPQELQNGVYFYTVEANGVSLARKKMVILK